MNPLYIKEDGDITPGVTLDSAKGIFEIKGWSHPEDAVKCYAPILAWLQEYEKEPNPKTDFHFRLKYYNSSSAKQVFRLISLLEEVAKKSKVVVFWYHDEEDAEILSSGKRFSAMSTLPFQFVKN